MKNRSIAAVLLLPIITFGIYSLYWEVSTKGEMNRLGAKIPTAWLIIVPIVNIWWLWKYSEGVEQVTGGKTQGILAFLLLWLLGFIGQAILQDGFNKLGETSVASAPAAAAPSADQTPSVQPPAPVEPPVPPTTPPTPPAPAA